MSKKENQTSQRIAIACQGGGSHTAFTAGALKAILRELENSPPFEIVGLSGTSGGAICALLAWYGLLKNDIKLSQKLLDDFWERNSASSFDQAWLNDWVVWGTRMKSFFPTPEVSPYGFVSWGQMQLEDILNNLVDFNSIYKQLSKPDSLPMLIIGAADVLSGEFKAFKNKEIGVKQILASTSVPTLFPAVQTDQGVFWDGLFSQNPPVCDLTEADPDEIWVIRVNPVTRANIPTTIDDIKDRRNELSGNLSLNQELSFIRKVNQWLKDGTMVNTKKYRHIEIREIELKEDLDYPSKLDRSTIFIRKLMNMGEEKAAAFLKLNSMIGIDKEEIVPKKRSAGRKQLDPALETT